MDKANFLQEKVSTLNLMIDDYARKSHLNERYRSLVNKNSKLKDSEIAKMTGVNSQVVLKLHEAIIKESNGDFISYLLSMLAPQLNEINLTDLFLNSRSGDYFKLDLNSKLQISPPILSILNERDFISASIVDKYRNAEKKSDEYLALKEACENSKFPEINPFSCIDRTFAMVLQKEWSGIEKGSVLLSHGSSVLPVDSILGTYMGMGETSHSIKFLNDSKSYSFWDVKWEEEGRAIAEFSIV